MKTSNFEKVVVKWILLIGVLISLAVTPKYSLDPINVPKMTILILSTFALVGFVLSNSNLRSSLLKNYWAFYSFLLFLAGLFSATFLTSGDNTQKIYGSFGRNTGLITYFCFALIWILAIAFYSLSAIRVVYFAFMLTGVIAFVYGYAQALGLDPIPWTNPYSPIIGFLGNPNFQSSFIGLFLIGNFAVALHFRRSKWVLSSCFFIILLGTLQILRSNSIQGIIVFLSGLAFILLVMLAKNIGTGHKALLRVYCLMLFLIGVISLAGALNVGPLSKYLYQISVRQRGYYWDAALQMLKFRPISGVGTDSFGDWYLFFRSNQAAKNSPDIASSAAHNVFLDLASGGGLFLLTAYLLIVLLTLKSIYKQISRNPTFDPLFTGISAIWIAFILQSTISINQIGLAIWGWIFSGIIIGIEFHSRSSAVSVTDNSHTRNRYIAVKKGFQAQSMLAVTSGIALASIIIVPYFAADRNYYVAANSRDAGKLMKAASAKPLVPDRTVMGAKLLADSSLPKQSLELLNLAIKVNPRNFNAWQLKYNLLDERSSEKTAANQMRNKLDPNLNYR